jgi:tetratricopeptide (TPR) repeat protein
MGVVYKAQDAKLGRVVALKMVRSAEHADPAELLRFLAEAQAVAALQHPHIVQVHEIGEHGGLPYFTLEFVPGGSLADRLRGQPQLPADAARLTEALARAVHCAHEKGIVHRDLKPANVLLVEGPETPLGDCTAKVTDFGLARRVGVGSGQTQSGAVMGTPSYMAPEQAKGLGKEAGPPADVYALGAILYELLTGRPPFRGATPTDTLIQVVADEPVPPSRLQPKLPRDLETICLKCLHKEPGRRYPSAAELAADLRRFGQGEPILARPVGALERVAKWVRRNPLLACLSAGLAVVVLAASVTVFILWRQAEQAAQAEHARATEAEAARREADATLQEMAGQAVHLCDYVLNREDVSQPPNPQHERLLAAATAACERYAANHAGDTAYQQKLVQVLNNTGGYYMFRGRHETALKYHLRALEVARRLAEADPGSYLSAAWPVVILGDVAISRAALNQLDEAQTAAETSVTASRKLIGKFDAEDPGWGEFNLARQLVGLGTVYRRAGRLKEAGAACREAEGLSLRPRALRMVAGAFAQLSSAYRKDEVLRTEYEQAAVRALVRAAKLGWRPQAQWNASPDMVGHADLAAVRHHPEVKALLDGTAP